MGRANMHHDEAIRKASISDHSIPVSHAVFANWAVYCILQGPETQRPLLPLGFVGFVELIELSGESFPDACCPSGS